MSFSVDAGLSLRRDANGAVRVTSVAPHILSAVLIGDVVDSVNGVSLRGLPTETVQALLSGPPGTAISLLVLRRDSTPRTVELQVPKSNRLIFRAPIDSERQILSPPPPGSPPDGTDEASSKRDELKVALIRNLKLKLREKDDIIAQMRQELDDARATATEASAASATGLRQFEDVVRALHGGISSGEEREAQLRRENADLVRRLQFEEGNSAELNRNVATLRAEVSRLMEGEGGIEREIDLREILAEREGEIAALTDRVQRLSQGLAGGEGVIRNLEAELAGLRNQILASDERKVATSSDLVELLKALHDREGRLIEVEMELSNAKRIKAAQDVELTHLRERVRTAATTAVVFPPLPPLEVLKEEGAAVAALEEDVAQLKIENERMAMALKDALVQIIRSRSVAPPAEGEAEPLRFERSDSSSSDERDDVLEVRVLPQIRDACAQLVADLLGVDVVDVAHRQPLIFDEAIYNRLPSHSAADLRHIQTALNRIEEVSRRNAMQRGEAKRGEGGDSSPTPLIVPSAKGGLFAAARLRAMAELLAEEGGDERMAALAAGLREVESAATQIVLEAKGIEARTSDREDEATALRAKLEAAEAAVAEGRSRDEARRREVEGLGQLLASLQAEISSLGAQLRESEAKRRVDEEEVDPLDFFSKNVS
jgi:hypothetical protein